MKNLKLLRQYRSHPPIWHQRYLLIMSIYDFYLHVRLNTFINSFMALMIRFDNIRIQHILICIRNYLFIKYNRTKVMDKNAQNKPQIIFILGGPGAGKGTQCDHMTKNYGFIHYSTGDLLRDFIKTDCQEAAKIRQILAEGKLAPSEMLVEIVKKNIFKDGPNNNKFLIDGFPRSAENYEAWMKVMGDDVQVKTLIYLDCSFETLEERLIERGKSSGRSDDNIEAIRKRFKTYSEQTKPFLEYYKEKVGEVFLLNGENPVEAVSQEIKEILCTKRLL